MPSDDKKLHQVAPLYEMEFANAIGQKQADITILVIYESPLKAEHKVYTLHEFLCTFNRMHLPNNAKAHVVVMSTKNAMEFMKEQPNIAKNEHSTPYNYFSARCSYLLKFTLSLMPHQCSTLVVDTIARANTTPKKAILDLVEDMAMMMNYTLVMGTTNLDAEGLFAYLGNRGYKNVLQTKNRRTGRTIRFFALELVHTNKLKIFEKHDNPVITDCTVIM